MPSLFSRTTSTKSTGTPTMTTTTVRLVFLSTLIQLVSQSCWVQAEPVLMWASQGAGSRGFPFLGGVANIFQQAGLLDESSSKFKSMSGSSSAAWFFTQLFFSQPYYDRTVLSDPQGLEEFNEEWMRAFGQIWNIPGDISRRGFADSALLDLLQGNFGTPFLWENILEITSHLTGDAVSRLL